MIYLACGSYWGFHFANNQDLGYMNDLIEVSNKFVWSVKVKCMFMWSWMQLFEFSWMQVHAKLNTIAWMKPNVGFDVWYRVIWVAKYSILVDAIMLNETQCNINYLKDLQCVIAWSVFAFLCVCLESLRVKSMPTTNLHVSIC